MSNKVTLRHFKGVKDSPMVHDGPSILPRKDKSDDQWEGRGNVIMPKNPTQTTFALETFLWAPWNKSETEAPSPVSAIVSLLWTFIMSLVYGLAFLLVNDQLLFASGPATEVFIQAFILGIVSAALYWVTMSLSWHPLLKTHVNFGIIFALVGTFDMGILTFLLVGFFQLTGYAAGGAIAFALGLVSLGNTPSITPPTTTTAGLIIYWFAGMMVILSYIFIQKFAQKWKINSFDPEARYERNQRAILVSAIVLFALTVAFRALGLYFFDAGLFVAAWAADSSKADSIANGVLDWAYYTFVPLASAAGAIIIYYLLMAGIAGSDRFPKEKNEVVSTRYRSSYNNH